jgi:cysteinyl-tRNA synthetase
MNITDVGHLTSDADEGEDKLEKGAKREGATVWQIAHRFTKAFFRDAEKLNIRKPAIVDKATDTVKDQIKIIEKLVEKGYAYETDTAVYFDVSKFKNYGKLNGQSLDEKLIAARDEVEQ